jgi:protease-4
VIQQSIAHGYDELLARVGAARRMTREQVDRIARGRIWSGEDAKGIGLVDQLGGLEQAIDSAAKRARLPAGYRVFYVEKERSLAERVSELLFKRASAVSRGAALAPGETGAATPPSAWSVSAVLSGLSADLQRLARWNDPRGVYAHCLCGGD